MAGTLTISTLSDGTNSTSSTNCIQGSAKAWVNFDGTVATPTIRGSYNIASVTKTGTGKYTVNFSTALSSANFSVVATTQAQGSGTHGFLGAGNPYSTTYIQIVTERAGVGAYDEPYVNVSIFR